MGRVLVVDDEKSIRVTLRAFLVEEGYENVQVAEDADQAKALLTETEFDVVVTDIILPRVTGVDLLKIIRDISPHAQVIMMTGEPTVETASESLRFGAFDYLYKPITKDAILKSVRNALNVKRLSDEKRRLEKENRMYTEELESLVAERTRSLRESEERLRMILDSIPVGVVTVVADTHRIADINPGAAKMIGAPKEALLGTLCNKYLCEHEIDDCLVSRKEQRVINKEQNIYTVTGEEIPVIKTVSHLTIGDREYLLESFVDISERKNLERQLVQAQKMEAIGSLAGGIAHDFNNILSSVIGFTELVLGDLDRQSREYDNLSEVLTAGMRAKELVQHILTFSRQTEHEKKPVMIKHVVKEVLNLLRSTLPTTIEIKQEIESKSMVMGDATQIHQVMMNLCTNAAHAMKENTGTLTVELKDVSLDSGFAEQHPEIKPGHYICLAVTDTGHGIPAQLMGKIFDPFFTTKPLGDGTGMGLSVVHGIVQSHDGSIHVTSTPGSGSCFKVYLPSIERRLKPEEKSELPIPMGAEKILLIDDEISIVKMTRQLLESLGYQVVAKTSSLEALELFESEPENFDLVITDMTMPQMTGEDLAKKIMSVRQDIPVVICTGFSERIDEEKAAAIGIRAFVSKPVLKRKMAETVRALLDSRSGQKIQ